jgi:hypothetical protein
MNRERDIERVLDAWLQPGPTVMPDRLFDDVLERIERQPQRRLARLQLRITTMRPITLFAAAAAIAVALGAGIILLGRPSTSDVGAPTTSPTTSPTTAPEPSTTPSATPDLLDTSTWITYASSMYGFTIAHPAGWTDVPATRAWTFEDDAVNPVLTPAADAFLSAGQSVRVGAWSVPLDPGPTLESWSDIEAWVEKYCARTDLASCTGIRDRAVPMCVEKRDCHEGALLVPFDTEVQAFVVDNDNARMIVVSVWREESSPSTAPYGGSRTLLEGFLSSMNVWPAPTEEPPPS